jgi:putative CocE/NonD family hydrolase
MSVSEPSYEIRIERTVPVPMRDGTVLRADVYRPRADGVFPVLVGRVGYKLRDWPMDFYTPMGEYYARRGYVVVWQNVRGTFASEGRFQPFVDDAWGANRDGYDTIEWAASQFWSDGKVGMLGGSYSGLTQYLVAPTRPPHLKALFVQTGWGSAYAQMFRGGAYMLQLISWWPLGMVLHQLQDETAPPGTEAARARLEKALGEIENRYRNLPLKSCPPLEGLADWYFAWLDHPKDGPFWWPTDLATQFSAVDVPIVHWNGWFDYRLDVTLNSFQGIRAQGRSEQCRKGQRLVIGPWCHFPPAAWQLDFGPEAVLDDSAYRLRWYDYWLKGIENGITDEPPVRIFLMGANRWLSMDDWPPRQVTYRPIYLRAGAGRSEASLNNGNLTFEPPAETEQPDSYLYDPEDPIPSIRTFENPGPHDYRTAEGRMLTYTSDLLKSDLTVIGPVRAVLYGLSSARDTDWVVRLCDVWPDGRSMWVCDGILRARYRNSLEREELMVPGQIYQFEVDMCATAQVFPAGHRLRVQVTSSDFPWYDRNLNTGGPFGEEVRGQVAVNTVFHDTLRPSHVLLPVIP